MSDNASHRNKGRQKQAENRITQHFTLPFKNQKQWRLRCTADRVVTINALFLPTNNVSLYQPC